jgi:hypothetical protein
MVIAGLLLALTTGYLTGAALFANSRAAFLQKLSSGNAAAGWTVLTPSITTRVADPSSVDPQGDRSANAR